MKHVLIIVSLLTIFIIQNSCNSQSNTKKVALQQCRTLGDESILYARANYVKLFNTINPEKFNSSYQKVKDFDYIRHRNMINTYDIAVQKLKPNDSVSKALLKSCKGLAKFSKELVDQAYPSAISFKEKSKLDPLTDDFFLEINKLVKFDHTIGKYEKGFISFKQHVSAYEVAVNNYISKFKSELSEEN